MNLKILLLINFSFQICVSKNVTKFESFAFEITLSYDEEIKIDKNTQQIEILNYSKPENVKILFLNDTNINFIPNEIQSYFQNLEEIFIKPNFKNLCEIQVDSTFENIIALAFFSTDSGPDQGSLRFRGIENFPKLRMLHLYNMNFENIDEVLERIEDIITLVLLGNQMENVKSDTFSRFKNLRTLELSSGKIKDLDEDLFRENKNLKYLDLRYNKIAKLPKNLLRSLSKLTYLCLAKNEIENLPEDLLINNKNLKTIIFGGNNIQYIPENFFQGLSQLEEIKFYDNKIEFLGNIFVGLKSLKIIKFTANNITKVSPNIFKGLRVEKRYFHKNPCVEGENDLERCFDGWKNAEGLFRDDEEKCGKSGGSKKYPWAAALFYNNSHICDASLITKSHILTAARCIYQIESNLVLSPQNFSVRWWNPNTRDSYYKKGILKFIKHPNYEMESGKIDANIAIGVLKNPFPTSDEIPPICLNQRKIDSFYIQHASVLTWDNDGSDEILEVNMTIICRSQDLDLSQQMDNLDKSICAQQQYQNQEFCGRTGGSLTVQQRNKFYSIGLKSWPSNTECNDYSFYSNLAEYHKWIKYVATGTYNGGTKYVLDKFVFGIILFLFYSI